MWFWILQTDRKFQRKHRKMGQETVTIKIESSRWEDVRSELLSKGFSQLPVTNEYMIWRLMGSGVNAVLYSSGKLVLQGEGASEIWKGGAVSTDQEDFVDHIGVDEVGKGDYFGPLVVCACFVSKGDLSFLKSLGVVDSKKLSDAKILDVGGQMHKAFEYEAIVISPSEYDTLTKTLGNVSVILAYKHAEAVKRLMARLERKGIVCENVVFDQFSKRKDRLVDEMKKAGLNLNISQFHGGESDVAVAAASILARYVFLKEWEKMEEEYDFKFPKGASDVIDSAKEFVKERGAEDLRKVAKTSFKTTQKVLSLL